MNMTDESSVDSMTGTVIHIDGDVLLAELNTHGWTQGAWTAPDGKICAHQAIRRCSPQPGDSHLIERVAARQGWGTDWNDDEETTEDDVRARLGAGVDVTDVDLAQTFGPQWRAVVSMVRRAAVLTTDEDRRLDATWNAARDVAVAAVWDTVWGAVRDAARNVPFHAVWDAADAAADAAWAAAWDAVGDDPLEAGSVVRAAARAVVTWGLATPDGPYTTDHRDLLIGPWVEVCGLPADLLDEVTS